MAVLRATRLKNSNAYRIWMMHPKRPMETGIMSAPPSFQTSSTYQDLAPQVMGDQAAQMAANVAQFANTSTLNAYSTTQAWQGSDLVEISIRLSYLAITDALSEVITPIKNLIGWPLTPSLSSGVLGSEAFLEPPINLSSDGC